MRIYPSVFASIVLALLGLCPHRAVAQPSAGDAATQADFELACAAEIKQFKVTNPGVPRAQWLDQAWEQRFTKFREPQTFFQEMKSEKDPRKLAASELQACGAVAWLEQQKSGVGSGAKARERWQKAMASFKERQAAEPRDNGKDAGKIATPVETPKGKTASAAVAKGRWPAGVEPGNLYIAEYGGTYSTQTLLISAKTKTDAVALIESAINEYNKDSRGPYGVKLVGVSEFEDCKGPNWGATVSIMGDKIWVTGTACGTRTPREAIVHAAEACAKKLGRPCRLGRPGDYRLTVAIGHSGARPWGGLKSGFGGPHLGGWPSPDMSFVALGASTLQFSYTNQYIQSPEEAINQFGKACGSSMYKKDTHSCWITSRNLGCVWDNNGQATQDDAYQRKCVDTKLTENGYLP